MTPAPTQTSSPHTMQCMEVWGGNRSIDAGVTLAGLDTWVYSRPFRAEGDQSGGGDIHYLSSCMSGRISRMLVADVSGHGAAVDSVAVNLRDLMRKYVNYLDQSRFVQNLNVQFSSMARAGLFATALVATYWVPTGTLVATNAGHPRPLIYRAATGQWEFLDSTATDPRAAGTISNLPLGVLEPTSYDQFSVKLDENDLVLIYTDSLVETRGSHGGLLGAEGLLQLLQGLDPRDPSRLVASLIARLEAEQGSSEFADDVTCLLIRRNAVQPKYGLSSLVAGLKGVGGQLWERLLGRQTPVAWPEVTGQTVAAALGRGAAPRGGHGS